MKKLFDRLARCVLAPLLALVCLHGAQALSETEGHCRALLIACDEFLSAADTESIGPQQPADDAAGAGARCARL